jgi:hypothetical protein
MPDFIKTLLGAGITISLSDREAFVKEISTVIEEYQNNPDKAQKWARALADYLEGVRDNINMQQAVKTAVTDRTMPDKEHIEKLIGAIEKLTAQLEKQREK